MLHTVFVIIVRTIQTLSWCQTSGKIQGGIYSDRTHTAFQEAFREDFLNIQTSSETICYDHSILET